MKISASRGNAIGGAIAVALALGVCSGSIAATDSTQPIQVSIGGGGVDSAAFKWSSALSQVLSRPPGLPACDSSGPCGIPGVIAVAQTYDDPRVLAKAIAEGRLPTGVLPASTVFQARCFPPKGQTGASFQILKALYRQPVQIVVRTESKIDKPKDFAGKTIAIGEKDTDSEAVALAILDAYGVAKAKVKLLRVTPEAAIAAVSGGMASAAVFVGHSYDVPLGTLMRQGGTGLLSLADSPERQKLLSMLPVFEAEAIPPGTYPGLPAISTLAQPVVWVAAAGLDAEVGQSLITAISETHNMTRLATLVEPISGIPEAESFVRLPAPLAVGAERFAVGQRAPISLVDCPAVPPPPAKAPAKKVPAKKK